MFIAIIVHISKLQALLLVSYVGTWPSVGCLYHPSLLHELTVPEISATVF